MRRWGGQSMAGRLERVIVCTPDAAGWAGSGSEWSALGYLHAPEATVAAAQHGRLCAALEQAGVALVELGPTPGLTLDAVYTHDASLMTDAGAIVLRTGKATRRPEAAAHEAAYQRLGIPILGCVEDPGSAEAGDLVWLDESTLLAGRGYRTNAAGLAQLAALLAPRGARVVEAPLPHGPGPEACLHLMSLLSVLDAKTLLVDRAWLAVATIEALAEAGFSLIDIDAAERETLAANVLALGEGRLVALAENPGTNRRLTDAGFDVRTFPGSEIGINGSGGPTCLTRPILRT